MTGVPRVWGAGLLVFAAVWTTGCDSERGGGWPTVSGSTTGVPTSVSASPSGTTVEPPKLPTAATQPTRAGAEAFFRYFWDVYNYSYQSRNSRIIRDLSAEICKSCTRVVRDLDEARRRELHFQGGLVRMRGAVVEPGDPKVGLLIQGVIDQDDASVLDEDGSLITSSPKGQGVRVDAVVRWNDRVWVVLGLDFKDSGDLP